MEEEIYKVSFAFLDGRGIWEAMYYSQHGYSSPIKALREALRHIPGEIHSGFTVKIKVIKP